jgi:hypothetical protein
MTDNNKLPWKLEKQPFTRIRNSDWDAELIVKAVNNHEAAQKRIGELEEALNKILLTTEFHTQHGVKDMLRLESLRMVMTEAEQALNKHKGEEAC